MFIFLGITITLLVIFLWFYLTDPRRIINGFLFNLFFCSLGILCMYLAFSSNNQYLMIVAVIPILIIFLMFSFGLFVLMIGMFLNARILTRKEGRRFSNYLTFIFGICLLLLIIISIIDPSRFLSDKLQLLYTGMVFIVLYLFVNLSNFLMAYFLYQFNRPKYNQDFIIVLGSGLINNKVPPLLASRINRAIDFYWKQATVSSPPTIIFSGGQGSDENLPEAEAMQMYAIEKGIPMQHTIKEDRSVNTYQNMLFSKQIMDSLKGDKYKSIFTTNNFHLFRAGLYAKQAGLMSQGIGSKTAFYYWPNAMIREYIAVVVMSRKRHSIVVGIILGLSIIMTVIGYLFF
ncbi:YdcF family protein [Paenibacillus sp. IHBB 10380]|uniref:YdcF family protein n=1 Tax=Paenibacillus sp. IHBB 10380 TaxID=1566358 RepID=UPI0005CFBAE3|nr:YdcF family protein [Paenibacillus sp. IHBB 10380]AJS58643.1 membrane protein [Paenibacillus sp. IHBB 10380]